VTRNGHERAKPLRPGDPTELGAYRIVGRLGRGGMGTVYLGKDTAERLVAIKLIRPDLSEDPAFRQRFAREVAAARRVARFSTAAVLDAQLEGDPLFIVSEYVAGPNLAEAIQADGPMYGGTLESLAMGVAAALTAIHGAGVIHRDLKPANVLLSSVGPKVIDFGIARALDDDTAVTRSSQLMGTPAYLAPELIAGEPPTPMSDIFSWGCLVAYAGTGRAPFDAPTVPAVLHQIVAGQPNLSGLDPALRELVESALDKFPDNRPTAQQLLSRLVGQEEMSLDAVHETVVRSWTPPATSRPEAVPSGPNPAAVPAQVGAAAAAPPTQPGTTPPGGQPSATPSAGHPGATPPAGQPAAAPPFPEHSPQTPPWAAPTPPGGNGTEQKTRGTRFSPAIAIAGGSAVALLAGAVIGGLVLFRSPEVPEGMQVYADDFTHQDGWAGYDFDPENTFSWSGYYQGGYALSADGDTRTSTVSVAPPAGLPEQVRVSATTQVVSGPDYGTYGLHCFYNDDGDNVTYYSATVRVDGSAAQIRRHGGEQGSTHLEEVTAKPVSGFLTPSRDAEEAPVNTFDFTCELDPEADTVTLNLWLNGEHVLEAVDTNPLPYDGEDAPQAGMLAGRGIGGGDNIVVVFDDFAVYQLDGGQRERS
jgi:serine/threonine protein kinase